MYTVYDFINNDIDAKQMKFGWKVEVHSSMIKLRYDMLDFDWKSLDFANDEIWNMFLKSTSYQIMRTQFDYAMNKFGRLYIEAYSISDLKMFAELANLKVDIDSLISKTIARRAEKIQEEQKGKTHV